MIRTENRSGRVCPAAQRPAPVDAGGRAFALDRSAPPAGTCESRSSAPQPARRVPQTFENIARQRREIDEMIRHAVAGKQFSAGELLVWQARVYRYSQQMEILSRVVDRTVSAVKTTLSTQI